MSESQPIRIAFVCVQNAGRSQMAYAFAVKERDDRGLHDKVELITGGTSPASQVHPEVAEAMRVIEIDLSERTPRKVTAGEVQDSDFVITMGCSAADICPAGWAGENRDWDLPDPHGKSTTEVAEIRDEICSRIKHFFDDIDNL